MNSVHERLQDIARAVFDDDALVLEDWMTARDVAGWDSIAHVNFVYSIEEEFDVRLTDDEFAGFENVGALEKILERKLGGPDVPLEDREAR